MTGFWVRRGAKRSGSPSGADWSPLNSFGEVRDRRQRSGHHSQSAFSGSEHQLLTDLVLNVGPTTRARPRSTL